MNDSNIDEISNDRIKESLMKVIRKQLNSNNVEVAMEYGSKKGNNNNHQNERMKETDEIRIKSNFPECQVII